MRALILSDIHSNIDALDAVLAAAPQHDVVWNLGDIVGYGAAPNQVMERAQNIGNTFVRGNHDRACCGLEDAENFNSIALAAVLWTRTQLEEDSMQWLRDLPPGPITVSTREPTADPSTSPGRHGNPVSGRDDRLIDEAEPRGIACVHGSLLNEDQYLLTTRDAEEQPISPNRRITFFGHTHVQGGFASNADGEWQTLKPIYTEDSAAESYALDLRQPATYLINPGSVGQPRDRDWRAAFAVYDDQANHITYYRVPYDVRLAQMRIERAGLPEMLGARLRVGR